MKNPSKNNSNVILDVSISGFFDINRLNASLVRFINNHLLINSNVIHQSDELFWKNKPLLSEDATILLYHPQEPDPEELSMLIEQPFDLENDRLVRFYAIKLNDHTYRIIYIFPHILINGIKVRFLCDELSYYYNDCNYTYPISLDGQAYLHDEFNFTLRDILDDNKDLISDFWEKQLDGVENIDFKFLETRGMEQKALTRDDSKSLINELSFEFSKEIVLKVKQLKHKYSLTAYTYGQLILAILLHRISGINNFVINDIVGIKEGQNNLFGAQANTILKRYHFNTSSRFKDLIDQNIKYLKDLKEIKAYYLPVEELIKFAPQPDILELSFTKSKHKNPFVEYEGIHDVVAINNESNTGLPGKIVFEQEIESGILSYKIIYSDLKFHPELVLNFIELYKNLFINVIGDLLNEKTDRLISSYDLFNMDRSQKIIHFWNARTITDYNKEATLHSLFECQVARTPDHTALVYGDVRLSYRSLNEKANQLAHYLVKEYDIQPDDLIPLFLERSENMLIGILGVLKAGGAYVPMDPGYPMERIVHILRDTNSRVVIAEEGTMDKLSECIGSVGRGIEKDNALCSKVQDIGIVSLDNASLGHILASCSLDNPVRDLNPNALAYVIYTSGTTGKPKGVMIEHSGVVNLVEFMIQSHNLKKYRDVGCYSNYVFDAFVNEVFPVLCHGNTLWLFSNELRQSVKELNEYIKDNSIEVSFIPPVLLKEILPGTSLKLIFAGGESFPDIDRRYQQDIIFINEYGPTECTVCATYHHYDEDNNPNNIGCAISNTSVYVLDPYHRAVPVGAVGELYIGGVGVSRGYLNLPDLTSERFLVNPFQSAEDKVLGYNGRIYKTGDLVRFLPGGDLEYIGRNDFQVKIRGYRIELGEIESALCRNHDIKQVVVVSHENSSGLPYLVAYYVSDVALEPESLSVSLEGILPDYMFPSVYVHMDTLPLTVNGKLDRKALPDPVLTGIVDYVAPQTDLQAQLAGLYGEVLGLLPESISIHDDFFRLGGNSIMGIRLISKIHHQLGIKATVSMVFTNKSIAGLSKALDCSKGVWDNMPEPVMVSHPESQYLSFAQERLWFIENYEEGSNAYNIPMFFRLNRQTDYSILKDSFSMLIERHEVLRSLILTSQEGIGYQYVTDHSFEIPVIDLGRLEDFESALRDEMKCSFNLKEELPIRIKLFRYNNDDYLSIVIHHISFDGWSIHIFLRDFNAIYSSLSSGNIPDLAVLSYQYKDFALWQRAYVKGDVLNSQLEYWVNQLSGFEPLNLSLDFKRPSRINYEGKDVGFSIPFNLSQELRDLSRHLGVSLYSVMLSGYYMMLSCYSGQDDIVLGTPVANRHYPGLENLIGFFVNTLVLRERLDFNLEVTEFIIDVADSVSRAQEHQDVPFEKLVSELRVDQDSSRHPVFQVMFGVQGFESEAGDLYGEDSVLHPFEGSVPQEVAKFDLTAMIDDHGGVMSGTFNYATALFTESTVKHMVSTYLYVLEQFAGVIKPGSSSLKLSELRFVRENHGMLAGFNSTYVDYNKEATLHSLFECQVARTPDHTALVYGDVRLSYRSLNEKANQLAHYLVKEYDIQPDDLIPLFLERSENMLIGILGVLKAGGAYVPMDPGYPMERIVHILRDTNSRVVIAEEGTMDKLSECIGSVGRGIEKDNALCSKVQDIGIVSLDNASLGHILASCSLDNPVRDLNPNALAYVIYTSGTTGKPKGVMIEHSSVVNLIEQQAVMFDWHEIVQYSEQKNILWYANYVFDAHVWELYSVLAFGHTIHLLSKEGQTDLEILQEYINQHHIRIATIPPVLLSKDFTLSLDKLIVAGDITSSTLMKYYKNQGVDVINAYGPTECTVCATYHHYDEDNNPNNIGRTISNTSVYVLDPYHRAVPVGAVGELYIGGVGVSRGYLNLPDLTSERFLVNPFQSAEDKVLGYNGRIYKTGDLVRFLPGGDLEYIGRNDFQVKIRGYRIELGEIESALCRNHDIKQVVVVSHENSSGLPYLVAYYVSDVALEPESLSVSLEGILPDYMFPSVYVHMDTLPLTVNGKLDRKALPDPVLTGIVDYVAPQTDLQAQLAGLYGEVLGLLPESISIHDDFFRLGGNSIMGIRLISKIHHQLGIKATVSMVFTNKSIAGLSKALDCSKGVWDNMPEPVMVSHPESQYLSFAQERLWFIENYEEGSNAYNIPMFFRLNRQTDYSILKDSFSMLIERHEVLRSLILTSQEGIGYQYVTDHSFEIPVIDLGRLEDFESALRDEMKCSFNLKEELPIRIKLFRYNNDDYLSIVIHHISFDGWSIHIFLRDFNAIYSSLLSGNIPDLAVLSYQYKDFALWQRAYVKGDVLNRQLEYWVNQLSGFEPLNLSLDFKRPSRINYEGKDVGFSIPFNLSQELRDLSRHLGVSLYSVMLSGYYMMLSCYSGQDDIVLGTPVANRHYPGLENLIGFFVNTLVLRERLDFNLEVTEFIIDVADSVSRAQEHQDVPFEKLVSELRVDQDSSRHPVFQVMFGVQGFESEAGDLYGEDSVLHPFEGSVPQEVAKFDLTAMIDDHGGVMSGTFNYATALFTESTVKHMVSTYLYVLEQFAGVIKPGSSSLKLSELRFVRENHGMLPGFNSTYVEYNKEATVHSLFECQVARTPDHTALVYGDVRLSYRSLNEKANQLAHYLVKEYDIQPDDLIPLFLERSENMLIGILGVLKAGGAYVPMDPGYPMERIVHILRDTNSRVVIAEGGTMDKLSECIGSIGSGSEKDNALGPKVQDIGIVSLDNTSLGHILASCSLDNPVRDLNSNALAYVIYTSGTTGKPKGVMIEHSSVVNLLSDLYSRYQLNNEDVILQFANYIFDVSVGQIFLAILNGNTLLIVKDKVYLNEDLFLKTLSDNQVSYAELTPSVLQAIDVTKVSSLRILNSSGEALSQDIYNRLKNSHFKLINSYGPTEATIISTVNTGNGTNNIGRAISNTSVYVLDPYHRAVPVGAVGELYIGGVGVSRGYLNLPDLTSERFLVNPFQSAEDKALGYNGRIYKTGDLVRFLPGGDLEYIGRNDFQVKIRGHRIELGEIESALCRNDDIKQAVVVSHENSSGLPYLVAYYVSDVALEPESLSVSLEGILPDYMFPSVYVHMDTLPLTVNGKLDRKALPDPVFTGIVDYVAPQTDLQEQLAGLYGEVLGLLPESISIHDDFFRLGGNSIMGIRLISKIHHQLGIKATVSMVFTNKSIAGLSKALDCSKGVWDNMPEPVMVSHPESQYLSFAQERLWFIENYEEGSNAYNIPMFFRLNRQTDYSILKDSFSMLIERHEVLRSLILTSQEGIGYQYVTDHSFEIPVIDLGRLEDFESALRDEMKCSFNLKEELPIRIKLFRYNNDDYLSIVIHHISFDGWSIHIFLRDFNAIYSSLSSGNIPDLAVLSYQYKDFALWQRAYVKGDVLNSQLEYWVNQLSDFEPLNLSLDFKRPSRINYEGKDVGFSIPFNLSQELRDLSRHLGVSLYSVMLSGYYMMLSCYSGQDDIVLGTPVANRHYPGLENLIGFFVNTLVLRERLDFNLEVTEFIIDVADSVSRAQQHQDVPFEKLVSELRVDQDSSRHPVFQVMFGVQGFESEAGDLYGEDSVIHPFEGSVPQEVAKFDLTTMIDDHGGVMSGTFNYATALFTESTVKHMASTYLYVLEQFAGVIKPGSSSLKLSELRFVRENHGMLPGFNSTYVDYNKEATLHSLFECQVARTPDHTALVYGDVRLSYRSLNEKANQLAHYLVKEYDIQPDDLIPLFLERSENMLIGILGVLKAGGAYVPMDPGYPMERIVHILRDTNSRVVIAEEGTMDKLSECIGSVGRGIEKDNALCSKVQDIGIVSLDNASLGHILASCSLDNPVRDLNPNALAYVIYTSGTTGKPKGVMIEHSGVVNLVEFMIQSHNLKKYRDVGCYSNYVFDAFVNEVFPVLCHGNTLWLFSNELRQSVKELNEYIKDNSIEVSFIPPVLLKEILPGTSLKLIFAGGESFPDIDRRYQQDIIFINEYGPTECTVCATYHHYDEDNNPNNIGCAISNTSVYVLDPYHRAVPVGAVGELYIGGVGVSRGYLNLPDLTSERFLVNPFQSAEDKVLGYNGRIYKTGDLVRFLPGGDLEYIGRNDFQVKIRGYRIELGEIESALCRNHDIKQVVVVSHENSSGLPYLVAYYVSDVALEPESLSVSLEGVLPDYMFPSVYVHMARLPLTVNGKLDRKALPDPVLTGIVDYVAPQTDLQKQLAGLYGEVLGLLPESISIHDDFFRLGGNSIMGIRLISKIHHHIGIQIKSADVFHGKTIHALSLIITDYKPEYKSVVALNNATGKPNLFLIHPGGGGCEVYQSLADELSPYYHCYGVDSYNLYNEKKISNLNSLALHYLNNITKIKEESKQEDYVLVGWCLGGQIALEIASVLESRGYRKIAVCLLDTILRAPDPELMKLSTFPSDEAISQELQVPINSEYFLTTKRFYASEYSIVGQNISAHLKYTKTTLLKAMIKEEKENKVLAEYIQQLASNNVETTFENKDLLTVHLINASHQSIVKENEVIIDAIKKLTIG